jgi:hypothetical protein
LPSFCARTIRISQRLAHECGEKLAIVHYYLAIAKPALTIQVQESPRFDNVFICFGTFHIYMAYFATLGYILEASGGPDVLCNAEVLAQGSMNGFLSGKHFNRCKRIHPLFATALRMLHFKQFIELNGPVPEVFIQLLKDFNTDPSSDSLSTLAETAAFTELMDLYETYCEATRKGDHGATAKFWFTYIDLVHQYFLLDRACRTNNVDLYIYSLAKICPMFFAANRPNYARWMTRYYLNMLNMENTHEGIRATFEGGALSIRRTSKALSRSAVDLALEQTINKDAASKQTGLTSFRQCVEARKRWTITRSSRGAVVGVLLEMVGLTTRDDVAKELKPYRIKRDNQDLQNITKGFEQTLNPFTCPANGNLYCFTTDCSASSEVSNDLVSIIDKGTMWHMEFIVALKTQTHLKKPIKCQKVRNYRMH